VSGIWISLTWLQKRGYGGLVLGSNQFLLPVRLPQKIKLLSKVGKSNSK